MKEQFIPYELAIKLKELGFDEICFKYYACKDCLLPYRLFRNNSDKIQKENFQCTAPLWQQAFDWFRKKGYECSVINKNKDNGKFYGGYIKHNEDEWSKSIGSNYVTFEEARLACIEKLIEIVQSSISNQP